MAADDQSLLPDEKSITLDGGYVFIIPSGLSRCSDQLYEISCLNLLRGRICGHAQQRLGVENLLVNYDAFRVNERALCHSDRSLQAQGTSAPR